MSACRQGCKVTIAVPIRENLPEWHLKKITGSGGNKKELTSQILSAPFSYLLESDRTVHLKHIHEH